MVRIITWGQIQQDFEEALSRPKCSVLKKCISKTDGKAEGSALNLL